MCNSCVLRSARSRQLRDRPARILRCVVKPALELRCLGGPEKKLQRCIEACIATSFVQRSLQNRPQSADVEGYEAVVLRGAEGLLKKRKVWESYALSHPVPLVRATSPAAAPSRPAPHTPYGPLLHPQNPKPRPTRTLRTPPHPLNPVPRPSAHHTDASCIPHPPPFPHGAYAYPLFPLVWTCQAVRVSEHAGREHGGRIQPRDSRVGVPVQVSNMGSSLVACASFGGLVAVRTDASDAGTACVCSGGRLQHHACSLCGCCLLCMCMCPTALLPTPLARPDQGHA
eukprot:364877-Chlamydomonas_euryale.AAC.4